MSTPANAATVGQPIYINPWRMFVGAMTPNWLLCRKEVSHAAKLCYARLSQYAGKNGHCFPKQSTLAEELGVSERQLRDYIRELISLDLLESTQHGIGASNSYLFLDHPWIHEGLPDMTGDFPPEQTGQVGTVVPAESRLRDRRDSAYVTGGISPVPYTLRESYKRIIEEGESAPPDSPSEMISEEISVPGVEEFRTWAEMNGIDPDYAESQWHKIDGLQGWEDRHGRLIRWQSVIRGRWLEDRGRWMGKKNGHTTTTISEADFDDLMSEALENLHKAHLSNDPTAIANAQSETARLRALRP